ncbi:4'-phosphopantetheinyl transferase superfamily protein [Spiractinospora alimapuensis]|nr:4'-phosphopantetheinyl transferase superfamily protein [Spiractinospora alimapuensis]
MWWAAPTSARPALLPLLDDHERERHRRFLKAEDRDRYLVSHALARLCLARAADCPAGEVSYIRDCPHCSGTEPHGKPRPVGAAAGLEFSITHSGDWVAVAVCSEAEVGVDVERIRGEGESDLEGLASYVLTDQERSDLAQVPSPSRSAAFFTYWTRKEALLKATGVGLSGGLNSITVSGPRESARVVRWDSAAAPDSVQLADLSAGTRYRAALATLTPHPVRARHHDGAGLLSRRAEHAPGR